MYHEVGGTRGGRGSLSCKGTIRLTSLGRICKSASGLRASETLPGPSLPSPASTPRRPVKVRVRDRTALELLPHTDQIKVLNTTEKQTILPYSDFDKKNHGSQPKINIYVFSRSSPNRYHWYVIKPFSTSNYSNSIINIHTLSKRRWHFSHPFMGDCRWSTVGLGPVVVMKTVFSLPSHPSRRHQTRIPTSNTEPVNTRWRRYIP